MRMAMTVAALLLLCLSWLGPLPAWAEHSFAAHMTLHVAVIAVAAPLLSMGVAGSAVDPMRHLPRRFSPAFVPALAAVLEFFVVWAWHAPALHEAARHSSALLALEQGSYLAVGLLVWLAAFGGAAGNRRQQAPAGIAGLLLTSMHMALLGVLLALAGRPLYAHAASPPWGLSVLQDQQIGGVIMLVFGGTVYLVGGLYLLADLLREHRGRSTQPGDRRHAAST